MLGVIFDGFSGDCRLADVRFPPDGPGARPAKSVVFGRTPTIQIPKPGGSHHAREPADYEWLPSSRRRRAGIWGRIIDALAAAHDAAVQMIDTSIMRVHQHGACITNQRQSMGRSCGGLTSKIYALVDSNGLPVRPELRLAPDEKIIVERCFAPDN